MFIYFNKIIKLAYLNYLIDFIDLKLKFLKWQEKRLKNKLNKLK